MKNNDTQYSESLYLSAGRKTSSGWETAPDILAEGGNIFHFLILKDKLSKDMYSDHSLSLGRQQKTTSFCLLINVMAPSHNATGNNAETRM